MANGATAFNIRDASGGIYRYLGMYYLPVYINHSEIRYFTSPTPLRSSTVSIHRLMRRPSLLRMKSLSIKSSVTPKFAKGGTMWSQIYQCARIAFTSATRNLRLPARDPENFAPGGHADVPCKDGMSVRLTPTGSIFFLDFIDADGSRVERYTSLEVFSCKHRKVAQTSSGDRHVLGTTELYYVNPNWTYKIIDVASRKVLNTIVWADGTPVNIKPWMLLPDSKQDEFDE